MLRMLARNGLQIEISALGAVGIAREPEGHAMRVKSAVAIVASPGFQCNEPENLVQSTIPARAEAIAALAMRTNHSFSPVVSRGRIQKNFGRGKARL